MVSTVMIAVIVALVSAVGIGFLSQERIVKLALGSWMMIGVSLGIGIGISHFVEFLQMQAELSFWGMSYGRLAGFFHSAQPTIMLVVSGLLLWFLVKYGQVRLGQSESLFHKTIWAILAMGSLWSLVWISLYVSKSELYDWLFMQGDLALYSAFFPLFVFGVAVLCIVFASKVSFRLSVSSAPAETPF